MRVVTQEHRWKRVLGSIALWLGEKKVGIYGISTTHSANRCLRWMPKWNSRSRFLIPEEKVSSLCMPIFRRLISWINYSIFFPLTWDKTFQTKAKVAKMFRIWCASIDMFSRNSVFLITITQTFLSDTNRNQFFVKLFFHSYFFLIRKLANKLSHLRCLWIAFFKKKKYKKEAKKCDATKLLQYWPWLFWKVKLLLRRSYDCGQLISKMKQC